MSYADFKQAVDAQFTEANGPLSPGSMEQKNPALARLYGKLLFNLVDDPLQAVSYVKQLVDLQNDPEVRDFYLARLNELKASLPD